MRINLIIDEKEKTIDLLFNGYNIIATTIYNEELTIKILKLIENELKQNNWDFKNFKQFLIMK